MIVIQQGNLTPQLLNGYAIAQPTTPLLIPETVDVVGCDCSSCEYTEYAFKGSDSHTNDTTSILLTYPKPPTSKSYLLVHNGIDIVIDNQIAEFFLRGTMSVEDKEGFIIDWGKVFDLYGGGDYVINIKYTMLGVDYDTNSHKYKCLPYNDILASKTYRIDFIKDGYFEDGRDYTGLQWSEKHRLKGYFGDKQSIIEIDSYINGDRVDKVIQRDLYFE